MIKINDLQIYEGMLGSLGWVIFFYYFRKKVSWPHPIEGFIAWTLVWWLRKAGMWTYINYKKRNNLKEKVFIIG